jgi:hypothetical protein
MGLRSVPMTVDCGYSFAIDLQLLHAYSLHGLLPNSMAQMPVPVAMSRTLIGPLVSTGEMNSFPSIVIRRNLC